jgi:ethanolamine utilization protein EutN
VIIGRIIGEIHGTIRHPFYVGKRLLVIEKTTPSGAPTGDYLIATDSVGAGADERVLVVDEGNSARQVFDSKDAPVRSVIVGIIDDIVTGD